MHVSNSFLKNCIQLVIIVYVLAGCLPPVNYALGAIPSVSAVYSPSNGRINVELDNEKDVTLSVTDTVLTGVGPGTTIDSIKIGDGDFRWTTCESGTACQAKAKEVLNNGYELDYETSYTWHVEYYSNWGSLLDSEVLTFTTEIDPIIYAPQTAPTNFRKIASTQNSLTWEWNMGDIGEVVTYYEFKLGSNNFGSIGNVNQYTSSGLSANTGYTAEVRACNENGCSTESATASAVTMIENVSNGMSCSLSGDSISVTLQPEGTTHFTNLPINQSGLQTEVFYTTSHNDVDSSYCTTGYNTSGDTRQFVGITDWVQVVGSNISAGSFSENAYDYYVCAKSRNQSAEENAVIAGPYRCAQPPVSQPNFSVNADPRHFTYTLGDDPVTTQVNVFFNDFDGALNLLVSVVKADDPDQSDLDYSWSGSTQFTTDGSVNLSFSEGSYTTPGVYDYTITLRDASNPSNTDTFSGTIIVEEASVSDTTAPTCTVSGGSTSWTNGNRTVVGTCIDEVGGSGCVENISYTYSTNINTTTAGPAGNNTGGEVCDTAGNCGDWAALPPLI